ncbi:MAG: phage shock protein E [Saprospiraceae bacterium]|jgi:phage shock protein E
MNLTTIFKEKSPSIIDVREPYECAAGMASNSINIPLGTIPQKIAEFKAMEKPIIVYCRSGGRSAQALGFLMANGVTEIYNGGSLVDVQSLQRAS